jgi:hypothetical protein
MNPPDSNVHRKNLTGPDGEALRLREDKAQEIPGTVEVVYADAWDELCDVVQDLADALDDLHRYSQVPDHGYCGSPCEDKVRAALRRFQGD